KDGMFLTTNSVGNVISGNYIGVDSTGTNALANVFNGVTLNNASQNTVGGASAAARNVISGNLSFGVQISSGATGNQIQGNYIGTKADGSSALGNTGAGIGLSDAPGNLIGGNVISGNSAMGMYLFGSGVSGNQIVGNIIGADKTGTAPLGNTRSGIDIE